MELKARRQWWQSTQAVALLPVHQVCICGGGADVVTMVGQFIATILRLLGAFTSVCSTTGGYFYEQNFLCFSALTRVFWMLTTVCWAGQYKLRTFRARIPSSGDIKTWSGYAVGHTWNGLDQIKWHGTIIIVSLPDDLMRRFIETYFNYVLYLTRHFLITDVTNVLTYLSTFYWIYLDWN